MIWLAIGISAGTAVVLLINAVLTWKNFRQQKKVDTLKYFINIAPKITAFSDWLIYQQEDKPGWLGDVTEKTTDNISLPEKRLCTDKMQSYLSEIELLSTAVLKKKILDRGFIKDFKPHFNAQWEYLERYIKWVRNNNDDNQLWEEVENLVQYLNGCEKNNNKNTWTDMKNLMKKYFPRK